MQGDVTEATLRAALGAKAKQQAMLLVDNADNIAATEAEAQVILIPQLLPPLLAPSVAHHAPTHALNHAPHHHFACLFAHLPSQQMTF